jgi:predicted RNA polymerase sigma factor
VLKTLLDVLEEQAGGYYDPGTKSFYLLADMPKEMTALLAAHEMTHALEDQRYDIDGRLAKVIDDDDASFALSALVEGSATIASAVYVAKGMRPGRWTRRRSAVPARPCPRSG